MEQKIIIKALLKLMKQRGMSQYALAEAAGLSRGAIAHYMNGRRELTLQIIDKLAIALNADPVEIIHGKKNINNYVENLLKKNKLRDVSLLPLLNPGEAYQWRTLDMDKIHSEKNREFIPVTPDCRHYIAFRMDDAAMVSDKHPIFNFGDVLIIDLLKKPENGDYILLKMEEDSTEICRIYSEIENKITFRPLNSNYYPIHPKNNYTIIGVVNRVMSKPKKLS